MFYQTRLGIIAGIVAFVVVPFIADAGLSGTLDKINKSGVITIGYQGSSVPFSYISSQNQVIGYFQDFAALIADAIRVRLDRIDLRVRLIPLTSTNRILLLQNGTIDLEAGWTEDDLDTAQHLVFSNTIFVKRICLLVKRDSRIHDFPDLGGKSVVVTTGAPERLIRQKDQRENMGTTIITASDPSAGFGMLQRGQAVALIADDVSLALARAKSSSPDEWEIVGTPLAKEGYRLLLPDGDSEFKELVDVAIARSEAFGEAKRLYRKWFLSAIPQEGLNLKLPMSHEMLLQFKNPSVQIVE